jgi:hypothetical protein
VAALPYRGTARFCPICQNASGRFRPFGVVPRDEAECPRCLSLERHRLQWLYLTRQTDLFDGRPKKVLHVAPEFSLYPPLHERLGRGYITADLRQRAMVRMDIMDIQYPDAFFNVILCSHVLEHVDDDRRAMREFARVLKPGGWAILLVPITAERTVEDPSITDPAERLRLFGQDDHVRRYGPDYVDRLRECGFAVRILHVPDVATPEETERMSLAAAGELYVCTASP